MHRKKRLNSDTITTNNTTVNEETAEREPLLSTEECQPSSSSYGTVNN